MRWLTTAASCVSLALVADLAAESPPQGPRIRLHENRGDGDAPPYAFWLEPSPTGRVSREGTAPAGPAQVGSETMTALQGLVARERFFALEQAYGYCAPDLGERQLTVEVDGRIRTVRFCDLRKPGTSQAEVRRFLRVWYGVLMAICAKGSVTVSDYDDKILSE
jgi:hypothetical protein